MATASNTDPAAVATDASTRWEERSMTRVVQAGRDQLLERSRQIVEAAFELLKEEGLEGLTIRAVLRKTGLSRRAFYERFAGKDDLMLAVFEQIIRLAANHYGEQVAELADPMERLQLIVVSIVLGASGSGEEEEARGARRGVAMSREHMRLAESHPEELQAALQPLIMLIARQLSDGMVAGKVRQADPLRLATLVYNLVSTTVHTELLAQERLQPDRSRRTALAGDIWEFCRRAVIA